MLFLVKMTHGSTSLKFSSSTNDRALPQVDSCIQKPACLLLLSNEPVPCVNFYVLIDNGRASYIGSIAKSSLSVGVRFRTIGSNTTIGGSVL